MKFENIVSQTYTLYIHRYKSRKVLAKLNSDQLADVGLTKEQALEEAKRPFWVGSSDGYKQVLIKRANAEGAFKLKQPHLIEA